MNKIKWQTDGNSTNIAILITLLNIVSCLYLDIDIDIARNILTHGKKSRSGKRT